MDHPTALYDVLTLNYSRFHYQNHDGTDCHELCSPMKTDDPLLWHLDEDNRLVFKWNDTMAESNHAFISGTYV